MVGASTARNASNPASRATLAPFTHIATVTLFFSGDTATFTPASKLRIEALVKELVPGATIVITGYSKGYNLIAKHRATYVSNYLGHRLALHESLRTSSSSANNRVTVVVTKL